MKPSLRLSLAAAFTLIATVPVVYMALWVKETAFEKEIYLVREKHLLLAKNITAALERYTTDVNATFEHLLISSAIKSATLQPSLQKLSDQFNIRSFQIFAADGRVVSNAFSDKPAENPTAETLRLINRSAGAAIVYTPVMADATGEPTIYLHRRLKNGTVAIATLSTDYIVRLQKAISFGRKGHTAIVDQAGNVLAHPLPEWARAMKNIAKVLPVQKMIAGDTGVAEFFSPAMKKDMISGYTVVSGPGWGGGMVPQPIDELEARANDVFKIALTVGAAGLLSAVLLGLLIAGAFSSALRNVVSVTRTIRSGDLDSRVGKSSNFTPAEFGELAVAVNQMADHLRDDQAVMVNALHDAKMADRAKTEFLANMSHELRTPLNAIIGFSDMLRQKMADPEKVAVYAEDINSSGRHLLDIIVEILDISRIEAGQVELVCEEVDIAAFVAGAVKLIEPQAESFDITIEVDIQPGLPSIFLDPVKQRQVFVNLLSNSVKFTPTGGEVRVSVWIDSEDCMAFRISDTGIGMSDGDMEVALSPFGQVEGALHRSRDGTGLGLPLAKRLVELQGGEFELTSEPDNGTSVLVRYPHCQRRIEELAA
jgi:signal transduction histidine kinase